MQITPLHDWDLSPAAARALQRDLAPRLDLTWTPRPLRRVLGLDLAFAGERAVVAGVLLSWPDLTLLREYSAVTPLTFPYVPGLLSFREIPAILSLLEQVETAPDLVMVDGQGVLHSRGLGLGAHLGLILQIPTIGCAKSRLCGDFGELGPERGDRVPITLDGAVRGTLLRTRRRVKPMYISPGHLVDVPTAAELALLAGSGYRLPQPTRLADQLAARAKRALAD